MTTINNKSIQAFRRLTAGVSVISAGNKSERYAMTASSVTSVSMEPASLLVCINKEAEINHFLSSHDQFCVNLLDRSQEDVSNTCATPGLSDKRFETGKWQETAIHTPYLEGAQANIFCQTDKQVNYASHNIYIAKVINVIHSDTVNPLVYLNSAYGQFQK